MNRSNKLTSLIYFFILYRYSSTLECGSSYCKELGYREHFHCMDCTARVFCKKEEMIRHFKVSLKISSFQRQIVPILNVFPCMICFVWYTIKSLYLSIMNYLSNNLFYAPA